MAGREKTRNLKLHLLEKPQPQVWFFGEKSGPQVAPSHALLALATGAPFAASDLELYAV